MQCTVTRRQGNGNKDTQVVEYEYTKSIRENNKKKQNKTKKNLNKLETKMIRFEIYTYDIRVANVFHLILFIIYI